MIKKIFTAAFFFLLVTSYTSIAQSKDETAIATAIETFRKAMVDANKADLEKLTFAELSYGHSAGKIETQAEFVEGIASGKSDFVSIDLTNQTIKIVGNTAVVRHILTGTTNDNNTPANIKLSILSVWQKQQGQWKMLARQAVKVP